MVGIKRRHFLIGSSALLALGSQRNALAQAAPAMTPHEKELHEAAKKEGGELTWYTAQSDDITAQTLGRAFESIYPGLKVNVLRTTAQVAYQRITQELKASAVQCDVFSSTDIGHYVELKAKGARLVFADKTYEATDRVQTIVIARDGTTRLEPAK